MTKDQIIDKVQKIKSRIFLRDVQRKNTKSVYADFAPTDNLSNEEESIKALHWALNNTRIKNVALAGPYGAGKSSVIESYLRIYRKCRAISISLASFDGHTWDKISKQLEKGNYDEAKTLSKELEDELEKGILKQLFYKVDAGKIPLSRYRKLHHVRFWKYVAGTLIALVVICATAYLIMPEKMVEIIVQYFARIDSLWSAMLVLGTFLVSICGIGYGIKFVTSKFTIKEISVGDASVQGGEVNADSVLNKNIDEMLYFFERNKYNVVFIEDLDRFSSTSIFIKLREINTILNSYEVLKKRIVFVYAVKDDLFVKDTERTKFFDFIIPVIPVINSTNSGEIMRNMLGIGDKKDVHREYPKHNISQKFVNLVSPYIADMRILISIINEFWIYKRTLMENQKDGLTDECMLALMVYKNLYPSDFALLEVGEGNIKEAFEYKKVAIKDVRASLESRRKQLESVQKDILKSIKELKIVILSEMTENKGIVTKITVKNNTYNYMQLLSDEYSLEQIKAGHLTIYYKLYDERYDSSKNVDNIAEQNEVFRELFTRYDAQCTFRNRNMEEILTEFGKIDRDIMCLRANTLQQLIANNPVEQVLPQKVIENELLKFLLRYGYINESYTDYINYFYPGSISKQELKFILSVRNFKGLGDFSFPIKHCANVVEKLYDYEFEQIETLNYDLMDFLLGSKANEMKLQRQIYRLVDRSESSLKFIKEYIERGKNVRQFVKVLCHTSNHIWEDINHNGQLSVEAKDKYLKLIIDACDIEDIVRNNYKVADLEQGGIKDYFEKDRNILFKMSEISNIKLKDVICELDICFSNLNFANVNREIVNYIIKGRYYVLNHSMMVAIVQIINPEYLDKLFLSNYHCLRELGNEDLLDYIYDDFPTYVKKFILEEESNTEELTDDVEDIIERLFDISQELCIKVIEKEHLVRWEQLSNCLVTHEDKDKKEIWNYLLRNNRTVVSWDNYLKYHHLFGLTEDLFLYANNNMRDLVESWNDKEPTDDIIKELMVENLSDESFALLVKSYQVKEFTDACSKYDESKLEVMIEKHYFPFSANRYAELGEISCALSTKFAIANKEEFIKGLAECVLSVTDASNLIKTNIFDEEEIILLLENTPIHDMNAELAILLRELQFALPKAYVNAAWDALNESDRYELLYNQLEVYDLDELANKFGELGGVYNQFAQRSKHKYSLFANEYNEKLCQKLYQRGFISSRDIINEKVGFDLGASKDITEKRITGYVRRK